MSNRNLLIIAAAVLLALGAVVIAVALVIGGGRESKQAVPVIPEVGEKAGIETRGRVPQQLEMVVFFQSPRRVDLLVPTRRSIFNTISLGQQADQLLQKLIQGPAPAEGLLPTVPRDTTLRHLYIAEDGTAYVVFNRALSRRHPGGTSGEMMTAYSIVDTLCVNFPSIRRVKILIEGLPARTLAGHLDITVPLLINTDLFAPASAAAPATEENQGDETGDA